MVALPFEHWVRSHVRKFNAVSFRNNYKYINFLSTTRKASQQATSQADSDAVSRFSFSFYNSRTKIDRRYSFSLAGRAWTTSEGVKNQNDRSSKSIFCTYLGTYSIHF